MKTNDPGYVYILTNPSFREDWVKIGKSTRPVDIRSKELDNTAVPLPFEIFATMKTSKFNEVERLVHKTIDRLTDLRIRQNREFFNVDPKVALDIFRDIALTIDDAVITEYEDNKPIIAHPEKKEKKSEIIEKYQKHSNDTGSTAVQIAILSERITEINEHLKKNPKDHHSRRGLLMMVGKRKGLMKYLERTNLDEYRELIADLGIRG